MRGCRVWMFCRVFSVLFVGFWGGGVECFFGDFDKVLVGVFWGVVFR